MRGHKSRGYQRLRAPKSAVRVAPKRELEISVFSRSSERGYAFTECLLPTRYNLIIFNEIRRFFGRADGIVPNRANMARSTLTLGRILPTDLDV
jgi:hypothetical protein